MKHFFTISLCFLALSLTAQETITYPYNPDGDADGLVAVPDLQDILAVYGNPFSPAEIMVGDTALSEWIQILYQALQDQQAVIDAMQGAGGCNWQFPEGLNGETVVELIHSSNPYIVPDNKHLYVISHYSAGPPQIKVDGYETPFPSGNPLLFSEGQTLSIDPGEQEIGINGILIEALPEVVPILIEITDFIPYQVPQNKKLVVLNKTGGNIRLTDSFFFADESQSGLPIIISSEFSIETNNNYDGVKINGYLVDEDYFADCGGGGSSNSSAQFNNQISDYNNILDESITSGILNYLYASHPTNSSFNYTVPAGKIMKITDANLTNGGGHNPTYINGQLWKISANLPTLISEGTQIEIQFDGYTGDGVAIQYILFDN